MKKKILLLILAIIILCFIFGICFSSKKNIENIENMDDQFNMENPGDNRKIKCRGDYKNNYLNNKFFTIKDFLNDNEVKKIINFAKDKVKRSKVFNSKGGTKVSNVRTSSHTFVKINENKFFENIAKKIKDKIYELTGENIPIKNYESFQIVRYKPTNGIKKAQFYKQHYDTCNIKTKACQDDYKRGGFRYLTFFIYLKTVDEGGETEFPNLGKKIIAVKGNAVLWYNLMDEKENEKEKNRKREPCSLHAGASPRGKKEKWGMNVWIRLKEFN